MKITILFITFFLVYFAIGYFIVRQIKKYLIFTNKYIKILILSFVYALFWGFGIAGSGGDPGFALPAPNIIAIGLMMTNGNYKYSLTGLLILVLWWTLIYIIMLIVQLTKDYKVRFNRNNEKLNSKCLY